MKIKLIVWDRDELSERMKDKPKIVDDFFGRDYVKAFNGVHQASQLNGRLDVDSIAEFRSRCREFYSHVFSKHDPGMPAVNIGVIKPLPIEKRYVIQTTATMGSVSWPIKIKLTNRDPMLFRILLGRTAVENRFLINPGRSYLTGRSLAKSYKTEIIKKAEK